MRTVIVVGGGGAVAPSVRRYLPEGAPVVAADGGADAALALGLHVDVVVGDLDSVTPEGLAAAEAAGARVERHPVDKDATDLALALDAAAALGDEIVVVGVEGGRLDHLVAGLLALAGPGLPPLRAHLGASTIHVLHGPAALRVEPGIGALVSLLPVGASAEGVHTNGLRYPLHGETLTLGTTRGVSNVADDVAVEVSLDRGSLLVVLPGEVAA